MILDSGLTFHSHVREKIISARRGIGVIRFLSKYVTRDVLDQMYKLYVRPHLDYGDIIFHKFDPDFTLEFTRKLESTQYTAALAVSGAWRGTNRNKLYEELGWEYLYHRRWYRRLIHFFKLRQSQSPQYLHNLVPPVHEVKYELRRPRVFEQRTERTNRFSNTYFQNCPYEWNQLDSQFSHVKISQSSNANLFSWSDHLIIQFSIFMISWEQSFSLGCVLNLVTYALTSLDTISIALVRHVYALQV